MFARSIMMASGAQGFSLIISADAFRPNLRALANAAGYNGLSPIQITVASGVVIANCATGSFGAGLLTLINRGVIGGESGGVGLTVTSAIKVYNYGSISSGGGNGGSGEGATYYQGTGGGSTVTATGGDGGIGAGYAWNASTSKCVLQNYGAGTPGQYRVYGGAVSGGQQPVWIQAGAGGDGGAVGQAGGGGYQHTSGGSGTLQSVFGRSSGTAAGYAVLGNTNVTWLATGTITGPVN